MASFTGRDQSYLIFVRGETDALHCSTNVIRGCHHGKSNKNLAFRSHQARTYRRTLGMDIGQT